MSENNEWKILKWMPYHKMGIKVLGKEQMENIFPDYERVLAKIEQHRRQIENVNDEDDSTKDLQYNLMYDNVFSIMGARGSGKTSVIFTLREILKKRNPNDIILPVIMSEAIPKDKSMIGWVLALLEDTIQELSKSAETNKTSSTFKACLHGEKYSLSSKYATVKSLCFSRMFAGVAGQSFSSEVANMDRQNQSGYDFPKALLELWDAIIDEKKKNGVKNPLIYLIFDDVDLVPEMLEELFSTIVKYLSHPNIIVLMTADEPTLYTVTQKRMREMLGIEGEMSMYAKILDEDYVYTDTKLRNATVDRMRQRIESCEEMQKLYVDKILPPSCRYYLRSFDSNKTKSVFIDKIRWEDGRTERVTLESCMREQVGKYLRTLGYSEDTSFLYYKNNFVDTYLLFMGKTSRQLANACFLLEDFLDSLSEYYTQDILNQSTEKIEMYKSEFYDKVHEVIMHFTYGILNTHGCYGKDIVEIKRIIANLLQNDNEKQSTYFDYIYLKELYKEEVLKNREKKIETARLIILLAVLLFFVENIFQLLCSKVENQTRRIHGIGILVDILDDLTPEGISLFKKDDDRVLERFLYTYGLLFENPELFIHFDMMRYGSVRMYLNNLRVLEEDSEGDLITHMQTHPFWFKTMCKICFMASSGIYDLTRKRLPYGMLQPEDSELLCGIEWQKQMDILRSKTTEILVNRVIRGRECNRDKVAFASQYEAVRKKIERIQVECWGISSYILKDYDGVLLQMQALNLQSNFDNQVVNDGEECHVSAGTIRKVMLELASKSISIYGDELWAQERRAAYDQAYRTMNNCLRIDSYDDNKQRWDTIVEEMNEVIEAQDTYLNAYLDREDNPYREWMEAGKLPYEKMYNEVIALLKDSDCYETFGGEGEADDTRDKKPLVSLIRIYLNDCMNEYIRKIVDGSRYA